MNILPVMFLCILLRLQDMDTLVMCAILSFFTKKHYESFVSLGVVVRRVYGSDAILQPLLASGTGLALGTSVPQKMVGVCPDDFQRPLPTGAILWSCEELCDLSQERDSHIYPSQPARLWQCRGILQSIASSSGPRPESMSVGAATKVLFSHTCHMSGCLKLRATFLFYFFSEYLWLGCGEMEAEPDKEFLQPRGTWLSATAPSMNLQKGSFVFHYHSNR